MAEHLLRLLGARMIGDVLLWGTVVGMVLLVVGIGASIALARTRALALTFPGARWARGLTYTWIPLVCLAGGGALGALHGGVHAMTALVADPTFAATTLRTAAAPVADGLVHAVAIEGALDPAAMLAGAAPIPAEPLRRILADTTGAAFFAGLRRVPAFQQSDVGRRGSAVVAVLGSVAAKGKVDGALEALGLAEPMAELAATLPSAPAATVDRGSLVAKVEQVLLPRFVSAWMVRVEHQMLWSGVMWLLLALVAPIALCWAVEGIVWLSRSRRGAASGAATTLALLVSLTG